MHVLTHADGLGWQLQVRQEWIDREQVMEQEYWKGFTYRSAASTGRQIAHESESAVAGAAILFTPDNPADDAIRRVTQADGLATIQSAANGDRPSELTVRLNNRTLVKQHITLAAGARDHTVAIEWPDPLIVQLEPPIRSDGRAIPG